MKILVITKDMASSRGMLPIVNELERKGDKIVLVSEGLSTDDWLKAGREPIFKGTKDFKKEPFDCDAAALVREVEPDVVYIGIGNPINLEERFALEANARGIPVVAHEDLWSGHRRSKAQLHTIFTLDDVAERVIRLTHDEKTRVVKIGNASVLEATKTPVKAETQAAVDELGRGGVLVVLMAGAGGYTTDMLRVTFESVLMTARPVKLIVRLHGKYFPQPVKGGDGLVTYGELWKRHVADFQERHPNVIVELDAKQHTTDDLARCCDFVISTAGSVLLTAASEYSTPISVLTPITAAGLAELMPTLEHYPLVGVGAAVEIGGPVDLQSLKNDNRLRTFARNVTLYFMSWEGGLERAVAAFDAFRR